MSRISFAKMSGAGNDFIFLKEGDFSGDRPSLATKLCQRRQSIGADGLVFVNQKSSNHFSWQYYNADGSVGEMCGNAARCMGVYARECFEVDNRFVLETLAGDVEVFAKEKGEIEITMPECRWVVKDPKVAILDSGVPHVVMMSKKNIAELRVEALKHRYPKELDEKGANITFINTRAANLSAVSFERGVEDFTLACGTGAVAAAVYAAEFLHMNSDEKIKIEMPGGVLSVLANAEKPRLAGPAEITFVGEIEV